MKKIKLDIQLFGGRGAYSSGYGSRSGDIRIDFGDGAGSEEIDVSNWNFNVKVKSDFEKYFGKESVEHAFVLDGEGKITGGYKGNDRSVGIPTSKLANSNFKTTLTHNHPGSYGGTLSPADIYSATKNKLKSVRAVAKEGTYKLVARKNANPTGLIKALQKNEKKIAVRGTRRAMKIKTGNAKRTAYDRRVAYTSAYHDWYSKNASKYGYSYSFTKK